MKRFRCGIALFLVMLICVAPAFAAIKVVDLKTNTWFKLSNPVQYKLKLSADSIITFSWRRGSDYVGLFIMDNIHDGGYLYELEEFSTKGSQSIALSKGTYYLSMDQVGPEQRAEGKVTVARAVNRDNYCLAKAVSLAANKTVKIAQTPAYNYDRWYKIKLTKKQAVTVTTNSGHGKRITFYNSKGRKLGAKTSGHQAVTRSKLNPGTYYIRVATPNAFGQDGANEESYWKVGRVVTVRWN